MLSNANFESTRALVLHKVHEASNLKRPSFWVTSSHHKQMQFSEAAKIGNKHETSGATVSKKKKRLKKVLSLI